MFHTYETITIEIQTGKPFEEFIDLRIVSREIMHQIGSVMLDKIGDRDKVGLAVRDNDGTVLASCIVHRGDYANN